MNHDSLVLLVVGYEHGVFVEEELEGHRGRDRSGLVRHPVVVDRLTVGEAVDDLGEFQPEDNR